MTSKERAAFRDHVAIQVAGICMTDLSRQLSGGGMPIGDAPKAVGFISTLAYQMADAMIEARGRK
jgi:hypothetical protein